MTLGELIRRLESMDPHTEMHPGFGRSHSWRGAYEQVAFDPVERATVAEMLGHARAAVGSTLHGWKGGDYACTLDTDCNVARHGDYGGDSDHMDVWWAANAENAPLRARLAAAEELLRRLLPLAEKWAEGEHKSAPVWDDINAAAAFLSARAGDSGSGTT